MLTSENVFQIGYISRIHGVKGEVTLQFTDDVFDRGDIDYLVLDMDGIFVPFFWTEYRFKGAASALFHFEDVNDTQKAQQLVGRQVFYPKDAIPEQEEEDGLTSLKALTGFRLLDEKGHELGEITAVDDSNMNVLMTVRLTDGTECLLPYHDDFLVDYDLKKREISLKLPEGLLDLNL